MASVVPELEQELARYFGKQRCVLVGSGTTALYCAFEVLKQNQSATSAAHILFPAITCETAVNACVFAGLIPSFADVREDNYLMSTESAGPQLASADVLAVVPTHIFGHLADVPAFEDGVSNDAAVIEDAAQGYGGTLGQRKAGGMGLASAISFGEGKLLDCGSGGALLCDDAEFAARCRAAAETVFEEDNPVCGATHAASTQAHRQQVMRRMMGARKEHRDDRAGLIRAQRNILYEHRLGYLAPCDPAHAPVILDALEQLDTAISCRQELTSLLDEALAGVDCVTLPPRDGVPALWRYSFLISQTQLRDKVRELKQEGLSVSRLFPPCTAKFSETGQSVPNSEKIYRSIVNLHMPINPADNDAVVRAVKRVFC